jgi:hypothetical protein
LFEKPDFTAVSQFFIDEWLIGTVQLKNDLTIKNKYFKYNGYHDRLIWINEDFQQIRLDKQLILSFCLSDRFNAGIIYCFEKLKLLGVGSSDSSVVFAEVLYKDNLSLYARRQVIVTGYEEDKRNKTIIDVLEKRNIYYFKSSDHILQGFRKINKSNILMTFPERKEEIVKWLRSQKYYRIRTEEDLIRFAKWLNGVKN